MRFFFYIAILAFSMIISGCDNKKDENTLIVGVSADYPPFEFMKNGKVMGYDIDFAHALAQEMKMKIKIKEMNFESLIPNLQSGRINMAISSITYTEQRANNIDFSDPYFFTRATFLTKDNVKHIDDLKQHKIAVQSGTVFHLYLQNHLSSAQNVIALPRVAELIETLKTNRANAILIDAKVAQNILSTHQDANFKDIELQDFKGGHSVALPKNSPLTHNVNMAIKKLQDRGIMSEIESKWIN